MLRKMDEPGMVATAWAMASGDCPACGNDYTGKVACAVCGGTGRLLPYRVDEGVRCATCEHLSTFRPCPPWPATIRYCAAHESPLWSPWIWHWCPDWTITLGDWTWPK